MHGFSAVLVINRVSIWPFWSKIGYGFCTLVLNCGMFFRRSYFFIFIDTTFNKSPSKTMFKATVSAATSNFGLVINRVGKIADFGYK